MEEIKAIETEYNGYRFRSRLEARWAVFFDASKIQYEYEPEGFVLSNGDKYLPDFYLPDFELYVEIKPFIRGNNDLRHEWENKCRQFRDDTGHAILLVFGDPATDIWSVLFAFSYNDSSGGAFKDYARFVPCGDYYSPNTIVMTFGEYRDTVCVKADMTHNKNVVNEKMFIDFYWEDAREYINSCMSDNFNPDSNDGFNLAKKKARQARFEHGEKPII